MSEYKIVLQETHANILRAHFFKEKNTELAAFITFGISNVTDGETGKQSTIFSSHAIELLSASDLVSVSSSHVTWDNSKLIGAIKLAEASHLVIGVAHSHIVAPAQFSRVDDHGESELCALLQNRNGKQIKLISLVFDKEGNIRARVWSSPKKQKPVSIVKTIGSRFGFYYDKQKSLHIPALKRQALAFGDALNSTLSRLSITVVGCGGTGSAVAVLLARLGVGRINLIDPDKVDLSNLNRLHGATLKDAQQKKLKVSVVGKHIESLGLKTQINKYPYSVTNAICRNVLKGSDFVFGCTDDNSGRVLLNRLAYFYAIPVIDMGLAIELSNVGQLKVQALDGRVTVLVPSSTCLLCRGVIDERKARAEFLKAVNPKEFKRQKREAYVAGEGDPNPSVVTFTTEVATMAVNELLHRITGYRGLFENTDQRTRLFHRMHDLRPGDLPRPDCPVCGDDFYWGRGDVEPFLDQIW